MVSDAQKKATTKYESKTYDKICLRIRKDSDLTRETIQKAADSVGESVNVFIMNAIKQRIGGI